MSPVFRGRLTLTQRCLVHKERNLKGYLSKRHWADLGRLFKRLRRSEGKEDALERLADIEALLHFESIATVDQCY